MTSIVKQGNMRSRRVIKYALLTMLLVILMAAAVLFIQISRVPAKYAPASLTRAQRQERANDFAVQLMDFHRNAQHRQAYTLTFSEQILNEYLASIDEIAAGLPGSSVKAGEVTGALDMAGLADPSVALTPGVITFMVRSTRRNKVLSIGLGFSAMPDGKLRVRLASARVGRQSLPRGLSAKLLAEVKREAREWLAAQKKLESRPAGVLSTADVGAVIAAIINAIDDEPIDTETKIDGKWVRIVDVTIVEGGDLTLHVKPLAGPVGRDVGRRNDAARSELPEELRNP